MAEILGVKIVSDSSELRGDIDKDIKKLQELSNKYKEVNDKLSTRGPEDFAKVLSKALEKNNEQLDKAKIKLANLEEAFDRQHAKALELSKSGDANAYENALSKQGVLESKMLNARAEVNRLEEEASQIVRKTTNEYNAETEALKMQAGELKNNFNILDAILKKDMKALFFNDLKKKAAGACSWISSKFKSLFGNKSGGIEIFKKGSISSASGGLKKLTGLASKFGMALFGAQTAFLLIRKAVSQILNDNKEIANTINSVWNGLISIITPVVNSVVSALATALNYVLAMVKAISGLNVLGIMNKANKKANAKSSGSKQSQQYSFDTAETLQKDSGSGTSIEDSYLKNVELSGELLKYANKLKAIWGDIQKIGANLWNGVKEGLKYMNSGERILQVCKNLLDAFLDDIKACTEATVEWSENLDFGPLFDGIATVLEAIEPILTTIGDAISWIYENIMLPISAWLIESGIPEFLQTIASVIDVVGTVLEQIKEPLQYIWDNFISPLATTIGEGLADTIINAMKKIQEAMEALGTWLSDHPEFVEFVTLLGSIIGIAVAIVAGINLISTAASVCFGLALIAVQLFTAALSSPIVIIAAIIAAIGLLLTYMGTMEEFIDNLKLVLQGVLDFVTGVFTGDWEKAWEGVKEIFKGLWNGIVVLLESAINFIVDGLNKIKFDVPDWVPIIGGKQFGFNIQRASLPRLAQGAIIPPNKEFLAVLGDQTRGTNIETPEALLRQVVQEESGSQEINIVANGDMAQLIKLLRFKLQEEDKRVGSSLVVGG